MLTLDLARLDREGSLPVEADVPADDPLFEDVGFALGEPMRVRLRATAAGTGEVVIRGTLETALELQCRRCLEPVSRAWSREVTWVWAPTDELDDDEDSDVRPLAATESSLDLAGAVREELILEADPLVVCRKDCRGLCPVCGINRNVETCECTLDEPDPRWDALRALKNE